MDLDIVQIVILLADQIRVKMVLLILAFYTPIMITKDLDEA
jgi:hypothetical protein